MDNSTSVDNPVNQIASLLTGEPERKEDENQTPDVEVVQEEDTIDESHPTNEEFEEDVPQEVEILDEVEDEVDSLNDLARELDLPIEDMYALNFKFGKDQDPVTLGGLKDFYESNHDIENVRADLKTKEAELQDEVTKVRKAPQVTNELLQARAQVLSIQDQYARTDWEAIRQQDEGRYAALRQDFEQQYQIAKTNEGNATQVDKEYRQDFRRMQQERLFEQMPELKDDKVRLETVAAVEKYVGSYGFTTKELDEIEDSRLMKMLIDASKITAAQKTAGTKRVENTPPAVNKPVAAKATSPSRKASLDRLKQKARKTGYTKDKVNAVSALLNS